MHLPFRTSLSCGGRPRFHAMHGKVTMGQANTQPPGAKVPAGELPIVSTAVLFPQRLPLSSLIPLCHTLRHTLAAGLRLRDAFRQQATRRPTLARPNASRISEKLDKGDDLEPPLKDEADYFPPLFLSM